MREVIEMLNKAKDVSEWNSLREIAKGMVSHHEISQIDGSGMCPKVIHDIATFGVGVEGFAEGLIIQL